MSWWIWLIIAVSALVAVLAVLIILAAISVARVLAEAVADGFDEYVKTMFWNR